MRSKNITSFLKLAKVIGMRISTLSFNQLNKKTSSFTLASSSLEKKTKIILFCAFRHEPFVRSLQKVMFRSMCDRARCLFPTKLINVRSSNHPKEKGENFPAGLSFMLKQIK